MRRKVEMKRKEKSPLTGHMMRWGFWFECNISGMWYNDTGSVTHSLVTEMLWGVCNATKGEKEKGCELWEWLWHWDKET